jgi:hypothetical protein
MMIVRQASGIYPQAGGTRPRATGHVPGQMLVVMEATGSYVRRITARVISLAERTGSGRNPWGNDAPGGDSQKGTTACRRSGAAQQPCMVRLCQTRVLG